MSIIVEGMEMPKKCADCPFFESKYHYHGCLAKPESINNMDMWNFDVGSRPTWCPLIELQHGKWGEEWFDHKWKIVCSECGCFADRMTDFCPNCGAKMDE